MIYSFATANLFHQPFEAVLEMIAEAGFQHVELDLYWQHNQWSIAQHLKDLPVSQAVRLVERAGLHISSLHDTGGVLEQAKTTLGFINPVLDEALDSMGYVLDCLVFHTPHVEGDPGPGWWEQFSSEILHLLEPYQRAVPNVTLENMPPFDGYCVPLLTPDALGAFAAGNDLGVTLDTTHYAQMGTDICEAAHMLMGSIRTIHLSDYIAGRTHVFPGDGGLDFAGFFQAIDKDTLHSITLECSFSTSEQPDRDMSREQLVARMTEARSRVEAIVS